MPDQNGIMTPQEIADQGVNALLKLRGLKQQEAQMQQQALLFQQQLQSGELDIKAKTTEITIKDAVAAMMGLKDIDPKTGQPKIQPTQAQWQVLEGLGFIPKRTPMEGLSGSDREGAAKVATGLTPSADANRSAQTAERGQDIQGGIAMLEHGDRQAGLAQAQQQFEIEAFSKLTSEGGANPYILSQAPLTDLSNVAKSLKGATSVQYVNAYANLIGSRAQMLNAWSTQESQAAAAAQITADGKNKYKPVELFQKSLASQINALTRAQDAGDEAGIAAATRGVALAAAGLTQSMEALGIKLPTEIVPEAGWFKSSINWLFGAYGGSKPTAAGDIDPAALQKAIDAGDTSLEVGGTPPPGAASPTPVAPPTAASPASATPPAATAPTSVLPIAPPAAAAPRGNALDRVRGAFGGAASKTTGAIGAIPGQVAGAAGNMIMRELDRRGIFSQAKPGLSPPKLKAQLDHRNQLLTTMLSLKNFPKEQTDGFLLEIMRLPIEQQISYMSEVLRNRGAKLPAAPK